MASTAQQPAGPPPGHPPLSSTLPPLILGTATFNTQYVSDPHSMPAATIVRRAVDLGVTAFDTSPYYGPSEDILGAALAALRPPPPRASLTLITKVGRLGAREFDYSPAGVRASVLRSLARLRTPYLDLVYAHDAEFVAADDVVAAVRELRRLRAEGLVRAVGISGYPVPVLCALAERVRRDTGEPLDAVLSYGHFTVQNRALARDELLGPAAGHGPGRGSPLARLRAAGVAVVLNASMLGMGLLTAAGIPVGEEEGTGSPLAAWHPSPPGLRAACRRIAALAAERGERLESVAIRWSLREWARVGREAGVGVSVGEGRRMGASVMGIASVRELEETAEEWRKARDGMGKDEERGGGARLVEDLMWSALGDEWLDYSWPSPEDGWVNQWKPSEMSVVEGEQEEEEAKLSRR